MSAADYRHFTRPADGNVISVRTGSSLERQFTDPGVAYIEVQVAPLDAVVIDGPLPKVKLLSSGHYGDIDGQVFDLTVQDADAFEVTGMRYLAIAAHLREHPPVDEAQVERLADALYKADDDAGVSNVGYDDARTIARLMVQRGARMGATS